MDSFANFLGPFFAFLASVTWAVGSSVYSRVARSENPATINTTRALLTLPFFLTLILITNGLSLEPLLQVKTANIGWLAFGIFATYAVGDALFYVSSHNIGIPSALAIASIYPLWAALFGYFFLNQSLASSKWLSILVIIFGVVMVIVSGSKLIHPGANQRKGVLLALTTSFMWAINSLATAKGTLGVDVYTACLIRMSFGVIFCPLAAMFITHKKVRLIVPWRTLKTVLGLFLFESVGGTLFFIYAFKHSPVAVAAVLTSLAPVIAMPIALIKKTDHVTMAKAVGILLVVVGVAVLVS